jgi:hypothetical protein
LRGTLFPMTFRRTALLLLAAATAAQDQGQDGGRDAGLGARPVVFVRWRRTPETARIYGEAWQALEPHFGVLSRRRLFDFDGDAQRARAFFAANADAALVVALDAESAAAARAHLPRAALVSVAAFREAVVDIRCDRERFARLLQRFAPRARKIAVFGPEEALAGFETKACRAPEEASGCDLAWVPEGSAEDVGALRRALDPMGIPLVSTSPLVEEGAALRAPPDAAAVARRAAAIVLTHLRDGAPIAPRRVALLEVSLDLGAARAAGHEPPLAAIARASRIRR